MLVAMRLSGFAAVVVVSACLPGEEATSSTTATPSTGEANSGATSETSATSAVPTTSGTTGEASETGGSGTVTAATSTTGAPMTTGEAATDEAGETATDEAGEAATDAATTGEDVDLPGCPEVWSQPTACTSPACSAVDRAWFIRDEREDVYRFEQRFAVDGSLLATMYPDDDTGWQVLRVGLDGVVEVVKQQEPGLWSIDLNPTAINFSIVEPSEGLTVRRLYDDQGVNFAAYPEKFCTRHVHVPDSAWMFRIDGIYLGERSGCEYTSLGFLDGMGAVKSQWPPESPSAVQDIQTWSGGVYYVSQIEGTYRLIHRDFTGALVWMSADEIYPDSYVAARWVDRVLVLDGNQTRHLHDGVEVGVADVFGIPRMAPHGVHSAERWSFNDDVIHRFTDGQLEWTLHTGFDSFVDVQVSDRGEVAVLGSLGEAPVVRLLDETGAVMWMGDVGPISSGVALEFAPSGDGLAIRSDGCVSVLTIAR